MFKNRYSIEVSDDFVEIDGKLTITETIDLLKFFEKLGYESIVNNDQSTTISMIRCDQEQEIKDERLQYCKHELEDYKTFLKNEKERHEKTQKRVEELECVLREIMEDSYEKLKKLREENQELKKKKTALFLYEDERVKKILKEGGFIGCTPPDSEITVPENFKPVMLEGDYEELF